MTMASLSDAEERRRPCSFHWDSIFSRKRRRIHNAILTVLAIWLIAVFFNIHQDSRDTKFSYYDSGRLPSSAAGQDEKSIVLKRHSGNHQLLNLLGKSSQGVEATRDNALSHVQSSVQQVGSVNKVVAPTPNRTVEIEFQDTVPKESVICDLSHFRTDVCYLNGDVRVNGNTVALVTSNESSSDRVVAKIKPYTRKWEESCMKTIGEVTVRILQSSSHADIACDVNHSVPAVIFSTGGYTGNVYHEFNDGLIPLFITSEKFQGEVVYMILELHDWWMTKYGSIVERLSNYPVIDFDNSKQVHCFPQVIVGLKIHDELAIDSAAMEGGKSIHGFQQLLKSALNPSTDDPPQGITLRKPRLVLITRKTSRALLNQNAVLKLATKMGFEVLILAPNSHTELSTVHQLLQSADVLIGVHGAALTHFLFMRPGSVFIQIIPLGTDWAAYTYYGEPAIKSGLQYIEYKISPGESTLIKKLGRNHTAITHPEKITAQGWWEMKKIYLQSQDVILSLPRFKPTLQSAFKRATKRHTGQSIS